MEFILAIFFWFYGFQAEVPYNPYFPHSGTSIQNLNTPPTPSVKGHAVYRKRDARIRTIVVVDDTIFRPGSVK